LKGEIKAVSGDDGRELFTAGGPNLVSPWSELAAGDIDGDGLQEIVAVHSDGNHLIAFEHTGEVKWISDASQMPRFNLGGSFVIGGAVSLANLDGQGLPEIVVGSSVFNADGRLLGDGRALGGTTAGTGLRSAIPAIADIDLDGVPEIVAGPTAYRLSGGALTKVWQRSDRSDGYVAIANFDDDPQAESVVVAKGFVYMLNHDGSDAAVWNAPSHGPVALPGGGQGGAPLIVDVDADGTPEIGVAGAGAFVLFNRDGSVRWRSAISDRTSNSTGSVAFDLNGDGEIEIIYRDEFFLRIYRGADGVLLAKAAIGSATWAEEPVVADVDNDGHADIVVSSDFFQQPAGRQDTGIVVLQDVANAWMRTRRIWNQHSYHITNVEENSTIPLVESAPWLVPGLNAFRTNAFVPGETADRADRFTYVASDGVLQSNVATARITVRTPNSPPQISSTPIVNAARGVLYSYAVRGSDPDPSDILTFSLATAPAGMTIDSISGLIQWTPASDQTGSHDVVVRLQDFRGLFALQSYSVVVAAPIAVPDVVGQPQDAATQAVTEATLAVGAISTRHSPTVAAGSVISQNPAGGTLVAPGSTVNLVVSLGAAPSGTVPDVVGQSQTSATGDVIAAGFIPGVITGRNSGTVPLGIVLAQSPAAGTQATSGSPIDLIVSLGPPPEELDRDGDGFTGKRGDCNDTDPSIHPGALDTAGDGIDQNCNGRDSIAGDVTLPTAVIVSPAEDAELRLPTDIVGTANDENFLRYTLQLAAADDDNFRTIASGTAAGTNGVLGRLDPTLLENGLYRLRLLVEDVNGQISVAERVYQIDGMAKIGPFRLSFTDLSIPVAGIPITIVRTYDSRVKTREDFGIGWTLDVKRGKFRHNRTPGEGWQILSGQAGFPCVNVSETAQHITEVRLSDFEFYRFALTVTRPAAVIGGCTATAGFRFAGGRRPGATLEILDGTDVIFLNGDSKVVDANSFLVYNPRKVRLTLPDGQSLDFDATAGLTRIEDSNGNTLSITPAGIVHSGGTSVLFERDVEGRIIRITDPGGRTLRYEYDGAGDLRAFLDQAEQRTTFTYDSAHNLVELIDPLNRQSVRTEYDADGRLTATTDANGNRTTIEHDLAAREEIITDAFGGVTVMAYDDRGNIVRRVDPLGHVTTRTFDARDNMLSETDPLGHVRRYTYDARDNRLTDTDALGNTRTFTYTAKNKVLSDTDPRGATSRYGYDHRGNLATHTDPLGQVTTFTYDDRGNRETERDPLGRTATYVHNRKGHLIRVTDKTGTTSSRVFDANGNMTSEAASRIVNGTVELISTRYFYDPQNRLAGVADAESRAGQVTYTKTGQIASVVDPSGRVMAYEYDAEDRLIKTSMPDGTTETNAYDAEGRRVTHTDRAGRTTQFSYDAAGRLLTTTFPDLSTVRATYDAAGRRVTETNELGRTMTYTFDEAGRNTAIQDPLGGIARFAYDGVGNLVSRTDRNGHATTFSYDDARRHVKTTLPDGTVTAETYDAMGQRISITDQAGNVTRFEYDANGNLVKVTDALNGETRYAYDALNNRVSQTDPRGNTTRFSLDPLGRLVTRTLPLGQTETRGYDLAGNLSRLTDFNGQVTTFVYDAMDRLIHRGLSSGEVHAYTYTPTGRLASMTDGRGITTFTYDLRDRPTLVSYPDGGSVAYQYDAAGNRTGVTTPGGRITYSYDVSNRLSDLTDGAGNRTSFEYDAQGNRTRIAYGNGVEAAYTHDALNRLTGIAQKKGATTLRSYSYTLGPAGNRTRVLEDSGRTVDYSYDALFRLVEERLTLSGGAGPTSTRYTYDAAGNRIMTIGNSGVTLFSYDANNRMLTAGALTLGYDNNGNVVSETTGLGTTLYQYDSLNRLVRATAPAGAHTDFTYDALNNRVRKSDAGGTTTYLVDPFGMRAGASEQAAGVRIPQPCCSRSTQVGDLSIPGVSLGLSQVLRETDTAGTAIADYVHDGGVLISQQRSHGRFFYLHDGQLSTRLLTDAAGEVTDRYDFDAFGNLLSQAGTTPNGYLYNGQPIDPNVGFYYLRARYYDPATARFTSTDPFLGNVFDPPSLHPYTYGHNDPVNKMDPTGEAPFSLGSIAITSSLVGVVAGLAVGIPTFAITKSLDVAVGAGAAAGAVAAYATVIVMSGGLAALPAAGSGAALPAAGTVPAQIATTESAALFLLAARNEAYMKRLFEGLGRIASRPGVPGVLGGLPRAQRALERFLYHAGRIGPTGGHLACALLHGMRLGYASHVVVMGIAGGFFEIWLGAHLENYLAARGIPCQ
jgi:RHS repeat-associated protein